MTSPQWLQTIAKIAPSIAAVASGPFAPLVGPAVSAALGLVVHTDDPNAASPLAELQKKVEEGSLTAEQITALKKADLDFQQHLADNKLKLEELTVQDVQSARAREIAVKDDTPRVLAFVMVFGFFTLTAGIVITLFGWPDQASKLTNAGWALVSLILGYLLNESQRALGYYFGTTSGNEASTSNDVLSKLVQSSKESGR